MVFVSARILRIVASNSTDDREARAEGTVGRVKGFSARAERADWG